MENPVLIKEIKTKMRSRQTARVQAVVGGTIVLFLLWCYYQAVRWLVFGQGYRAGEDGWAVGIGIQAILIWLLCPSLAANAISQEKEQQTWEMMLFTLL